MTQDQRDRVERRWPDPGRPPGEVRSADRRLQQRQPEHRGDFQNYPLP